MKRFLELSSRKAKLARFARAVSTTRVRSVNESTDLAADFDAPPIEVFQPPEINDDHSIDGDEIDGDDDLEEEETFCFGKMTPYELKLRWAFRRVQLQLSDNQIKELLPDFRDFIPSTSREERLCLNHIKKINNELLKPSQLETVLVCAKCAISKCGISEHADDVKVTTINIIPQVEAIVRSNFDQLHTEVRLTLNTDGVEPRDHKTTHFWPIFISVQSLSTDRRGLIENAILAGLISNCKHPSTEILELAVARLKNWFPSCQITVDVKGARVDIALKLENGVMDNPACCVCYTLKQHASKKPACRACLAVPQYVDGAMRYHLTSNVNGQQVPKRSGTIIEDGILRHTAISQILPITSMRIDPLHACDEGFLTSLLTWMFKKETLANRKPLYLDNYGMRLLKEYGKSNGRLSSTEKKHEERLLQMSGHEKRYAFYDLTPLAMIHWWKNPNLHPQAALIKALWICLRILARSDDANELRIVADTLQAIGPRFEFVFGSKFRTLKCHQFFCHGPTDLLESGNFTQFSAATFEGWNLAVQRNVHYANTRSFHEAIVERHILSSMITDYINIRDNSPDFANWWDATRKVPKKFTKYPKCKLSTVSAELNAVRNIHPDAMDVKVVSTVRVFADLVQVTHSDKYLIIRQRNGYLVVKPHLGYIWQEKTYVLVTKVAVSDPLADVSGFDYLAQIDKYQKFFFTLDENYCADPEEFHVITSDAIIAYLFPFNMDGTTYLIDGTEIISRL